MSTEMQIVQSSESISLPQTEVQARIDAMIANRRYLVEKIRDILIKDTDTYRFDGMKKDSLSKSGAEKLGVLFGYTAKFTIDRETMEAIGEMAAGKRFVAYVCDFFNKAGDHVGQGRGACFVEFERTQYRNAKPEEYAKAKESPDFKEEDWKMVSGKYGTFYKVKDGNVFDQLALNKAIKMAQKSAFVDGTIRATGMSDLFTQDVEDSIDDHNQNLEEDGRDKPASTRSKPATKPKAPETVATKPTPPAQTDPAMIIPPKKTTPPPEAPKPEAPKADETRPTEEQAKEYLELLTENREKADGITKWITDDTQGLTFYQLSPTVAERYLTAIKKKLASKKETKATETAIPAVWLPFIDAIQDEAGIQNMIEALEIQNATAEQIAAARERVMKRLGITETA